MAEQMKTLVYVSRPKRQADPDAMLMDIHRTANDRNATLGICGALFYTGDAFLQVLEGPPVNVDSLMESIKADKRHRDVEILFDESGQHKVLESWNMQPINLTNHALFSADALRRAIELTSKSIAIDADFFIFLVEDMLQEEEFQRALMT